MIMTAGHSERFFGLTSMPARTGLGIAVCALIALASWTGAARADECTSEGAVKSAQLGSAPVELSFRNASTERRRIYWLDANGERKFYGVVEPEHVLQQSSYPGFVWLVTDDAEECLSIYTASEAPATVDIGGAATAELIAPPPGANIPLVPPPAGIAEVPLPAAAVADAPPPVSPIEQFQLSGSYRLIPPDVPQKALNNESSGATEITRVKPQWDSAKWTFEEVPGTPYVRIKNDWKHTYLSERDGKLRSVFADADAEEAQWSVEPLDGTTYVQLRNRSTENYLLTVYGEPVLADHVPEKHENRSRWDIVSTTEDPVASVVDNSYSEAVAGCRAIGGYWTGSSCRAPREDVVLTCPRGWQWSGLTGECQWVGRGGACPPWQQRNGRCLTQADLTCRGGVVRLSGRGLSCQCPPGMAAWGRYPHLKCVPSLARVVPLIQQLLGGGQNAGNRPGNQQFGGNGAGQGPGARPNRGPGNRPGNRQGQGQNQLTGNKAPGIVTPIPPPVVKQTVVPQPQTQPQTATVDPAEADRVLSGLKGGKKTIKVNPKTGVKTTTVTGIDPKTGNKATYVTTINPKTGIETRTSTGVDPKTGKGGMAKWVFDPKTGTKTVTEGEIVNGKVSTAITRIDAKDPKTGQTKTSYTVKNGKTGQITAGIVEKDGKFVPNTAQQAGKNGKPVAVAPPPPIVKQVQTPAAPPTTTTSKIITDPRTGKKIPVTVKTAIDPKTGITTTTTTGPGLTPLTVQQLPGTPIVPPPIVKQVRPRNGQNGNVAKQTAVPPLPPPPIVKQVRTPTAPPAPPVANKPPSVNTALQKAQQDAAAKAKAAALKAQQDAAARAKALAATKAAQQAAIAKAQAAAKAAAQQAQQQAAARAKALAAAKAAQQKALAATKAAQQAAIAKAQAAAQAAAQKAQQQAIAKAQAAAKAAAQQAQQQAAARAKALAAAKAAQQKALAAAKAAQQKAQQQAIAKAQAAAQQAVARAKAQAAAQQAAQRAAAMARAASNCKPPRKFVGGQCR